MKYLAILAVLVLASCSTGSGPSAPASTAPANLHQSPVVAPAAANLPLDSADWCQEFVQWPGTQGALTLQKLTVHPTAPGCPPGDLCEPFPDRNATPANFMSYLLYELPTSSAPELNPKTTPNSGILGYASVTIKVEIGASPSTLFKFDSEPVNLGVTPAHIRPVLVYSAFKTVDRWWSHYPANGPDTAAILLAPGTFTLTVPLEQHYWVDVAGHYATSITPEADGSIPAVGFQTTLANPQYVGLGFGGGLYFDHGVAVSGGAAQFRLTNYSFGK